MFYFTVWNSTTTAWSATTSGFYGNLCTCILKRNFSSYEMHFQKSQRRQCRFYFIIFYIYWNPIVIIKCIKLEKSKLFECVSRFVSWHGRKFSKDSGHFRCLRTFIIPSSFMSRAKKMSIRIRHWFFIFICLVSWL